MPPPSARSNNRIWWIVGGITVLLILGGLVWVYAFGGKPAATPGPTTAVIGANGSPGATLNSSLIHPPAATPISPAPSSPAGDGTTATIQTDLGTIKFEVYNQSAPVASENFINLANANFYNGTVFHRIVPGFVIQGGDPNGDGTGGPGYTIQDEPVVGDYTRGIVAMARTSAPNSAGSQFFIVLDDSVKDNLPESGGYVIFGKVTEGMDVVDQIAAGEADQQMALDPVTMNSVTIQPGAE
jgi:cyclophilin family peptidyl-prolyl cis-trans isomerase